jgi:hypothetical protein
LKYLAGPKLKAQAPYSTTSIALQAQDKRVYTNINLQGATQRFEDSIRLREGSDKPKPARATREATTFQDLS